MSGKDEEKKKRDRAHLKEKDIIVLRDFDGTAEYEFTITEFLGMGSSAVCYRAIKMEKDHNIIGTLKEFYPFDNPDDNASGFNIIRRSDSDKRKDHQLFVGEHITIDNFICARNDYYEASKTVSKFRDKENDIFEKIPHLEVYKGIAEGECSYYFWYPFDVETVPFDKVLEEITSDTINNKNKLYNLIFILKAFRNLASAVNLLHAKRYCHLDIAPGNFGLKKEEGKITQRISLFDVNTVNTVATARVRFAGTRGFRNPYFRVEPIPRLQHDIFSIGACLFYSVIINKGAENVAVNTYFLEPDKELKSNKTKVNEKYYRERFNNIEAFVENSLLFNGCEETQDKNIRKAISDILKKCVSSDFELRYSEINEFIKDIDAVIAKLDMWYCAKTSNENSRTTVKIVNEDKESLCGIQEAVCNLLYEHPLYDYACESTVSAGEAKMSEGDGQITEGTRKRTKKSASNISSVYENSTSVAEPEEEKSVNILLLGGGLYAGTFIDTASQLLQLKGFKAHFTVLSYTPEEDKKAFLAKRKGYEDFFEIDGKKAARVQDDDDPYAYIDFRKICFDEGVSADIRKQRVILGDYLSGDNKDYRFVFCALHRDDLNFHVAAAAKELLAGENKVFSYVVFGDTDREGEPVLDFSGNDAERYTSGGLVPVKLHGEYEKTAQHKFLEQMAFNIHLLWEGTLSNIKEVRSLYEKNNYAKSSSFASALTIQYRLKSIGIEPDYKNAFETAKAAEETLRDDNIVAKLAMYEHRRWNIEKIAGGWSVLPEDDYKLLTTDNKLKEPNRHTCIVPSTAKNGLKDDYWTADGCVNWNNPDEGEFKKLDPLDRMSVKLHQHFYENRNSADTKKIEIEIEKLKKMSDGNSGLENIFEVFRASVIALLVKDEAEGTDEAESPEKFKAVYRKKKSDINSFKYYKNRLLKVFSENRTYEEYKEFEDALKAISKELFPIIEAYAFTDYKKKDEDIIRNIPFILTYSDKLIIAAPLTGIGSKDPTDLFNNAAALLHINPEKVYYVLHFTDELQKKADTVKEKLKFISALLKNHGIETEMHLILLARRSDIIACEKLAEKLSEYLGNNGGAEALGYTSNAKEALNIYLTSHCKGANAISAAENRGELFSGALGIETEIPWFSFNSEKQKFTCNCAESSFVSYIPFKPSLYADDLFLARGRNSRYKEPQIRNSCKYIWENIYKAPDCEVTESFEKKKEWDLFCAFVKELSQTKLFEIDLDSDDDTYQRFIYSFPCEYKETFEKLMTVFKEKEIVEDFSINYENSYTVSLDITALSAVDEKIHLLLAGGSTFLTDAQKLIIEKDVLKLSVSYDNLLVYDSGEYSSSFSDFSDITERLYKQKIICGKTDRSFVCTSSVIKKLLSDNEFIFRLYVYYKLIETGYFDEVRTDVSFDIGSSAEDEIDILAVKGFRTFIISCKSTADTVLLKNVPANTFAKACSNGINSQGILIADTMKNNEKFFKTIASVIDDSDIMGIFRNEELFITSDPTSTDVGTSLVKRLRDM